jgi:YesN/AraC family two-component response regulator
MNKTTNKTVLYVDNESINISLFEALFKSNFNVITAISAFNGLKILERNHVDLVITDFKMPVMNGIDFIREIKKNHPEMKCIIISGFHESQVINIAEKELVHKFIMKPWQKDTILEAIEMIFSL